MWRVMSVDACTGASARGYARHRGVVLLRAGVCGARGVRPGRGSRLRHLPAVHRRDIAGAVARVSRVHV